jgi:hypothetical protein
LSSLTDILFAFLWKHNIWKPITGCYYDDVDITQKWIYGAAVGLRKMKDDGVKKMWKNQKKAQKEDVTIV